MATLEAGLSFTEIIIPFLPLIGTILGGLILGIFTHYNRKRGNLETRAPDVNEIWLRQAADQMALDHERKLRRRYEDLIYEILTVFKSYVNRVRRGGSTDLNTRELNLYETKYSALVSEEKKE